MSYQDYLNSDFAKAMREFEEQKRSKERPKERSFKTFCYKGRKYKQYDDSDDWIDIGPQLITDFGSEDRTVQRRVKETAESSYSLERLFETCKKYILPDNTSVEKGGRRHSFRISARPEGLCATLLWMRVKDQRIAMSMVKFSEKVSVPRSTIIGVSKQLDTGDISKAKRAKPQSKPKPKVESKPKPQSKPKPKVESKPKPQSKPKPKVESKPKPQSKPKPKVESKPKPQSKPKPKVESKPKPQSKPKPKVESKPKPQSNPKPRPQSKPKPKRKLDKTRRELNKEIRKTVRELKKERSARLRADRATQAVREMGDATMKELRSIARRQDIKGRSKAKSKAYLIQLIEKKYGDIRRGVYERRRPRREATKPTED